MKCNMFEKIGGLKNFWYVIGLSKDLKKWNFFESSIYGVPLLLWRWNSGEVFCFINVCPHRKAKLMVKNFDTNEVFCQYHGWEFDKDGNISEIPSSPQFAKKLWCKCTTLKTAEKNGFIYIFLWEEDNISEIPDFEHNNKYGNYYAKALFETDEENLIENFMDATHTPFVHNKIIRDNDKKSTHSIKIKRDKNFLQARFSETNENIWLGMNTFFKNALKIYHTDEFLLPNIVKVDYYINSIHRFQAIIYCTEYEEWKTQAFVKISYYFGIFNIFLKIFLPFFAKKVLKQDFDITKIQYENIKKFPNQRENHIDYDFLHNQMRFIRKNIRENKENTAEIEKEIQIIV